MEHLLGPCPRVLKPRTLKIPFSFYFCENQKLYPSCKKPGEICAFDIAQKERDIEALTELAEICQKKGYAIRPYSWREKWLNEICWLVNIEGEGRRRTFSAKHTTNRCRILRVNDLKNYKATKLYHQRSSAFDNCHLARIWANVLRKKLPVKIKDSLISRVGTLEHKLQNYEGDNAEVEIEYEFAGHVVRGHADRLFKFVNVWGETEGLGALDFKHTEYSSSESPKYKLQMLSYCLGAAQILNLNPKYFRLITSRTPFGEDEYKPRETQTLMTQIPNKTTNEIVKQLHAEMTDGVEKQRELLENLESAVAYQNERLSKKCRGCFTWPNRKTGKNDAPCFHKQICDSILSESEKNKTKPASLLRKRHWVPTDYALC